MNVIASRGRCTACARRIKHWSQENKQHTDSMFGNTLAEERDGNRLSSEETALDSSLYEKHMSEMLNRDWPRGVLGDEDGRRPTQEVGADISQQAATLASGGRPLLLNMESVDPVAVAPHVEANTEKLRMRAYSPFWVWLAHAETTFPNSLLPLSIVLVLIAAVGSAVPSMRITDNLLQSIPRGTNSYESFRRLQETFGVGSIDPYRVMLEARREDASILTSGFWDVSQHILGEMATRLQPDVDGSDFQFMSYSVGNKIPWRAADVCMRRPAVSVLCGEILYLVDLFTDARRQKHATFGFIRTKFDPLGNKGQAFLHKLRSVADEWSARSGVRITIVGSPANQLDIIQIVYGIFPTTIAIMLSIILLALGIVFRSVLIPIRSVLSILLTLFWVYGLAVLTYQWGILDWTGLGGLSGAFKAQPWCIPIVSFFIVVGICLDYDIFLLTRATEFRSMGMHAHEAVQHALCSTGGIITAAGVIMSIAFGGLLFSTMLQVNALAFFMVFAVLCDTFMVRCLVAPATMAFVGRFNWWPGPLHKDREGTLSVSLLSPAASPAAMH
eukprot:gnl/TRDRNA2_/TRDRNA2_120137_c3_seq1.p1 gnl/TRDRNA2_/TRDRNA2_120137_c3~~gnl/TRDRNA2_/TRDRNA2_120137_c3_seq1.p1  ORF type:complete len:649 (+),score=55.25 gnl/TRDRNA2_/TRDRNA2_120137_c3_seq1:276-1949(+)